MVLGWWNLLLAQPSYKEVDVKDGGTIRGTVRLSGDVPKVEKMEISKDNKQCGRAKPSPRLQVGKNNGVRYAIVSIEGLLEGKKMVSNTKLTLDQRKCVYEPHVMILPLGTLLEITNSDPILHNVHAYQAGATVRSVFNIAQPIKGQRTSIKPTLLNKLGLVLTTCDAGHPWMSGYIMVADHPYYAVTDENGSFLLDHVPPGIYKLKMWHEGVAITEKEMEKDKVKKYHYEEPYEMMKEVTVPPSGNVTVDFELVLR